MPDNRNAVVRLKGKQVRILYDLVTVFKEYEARCFCTVTGQPGRLLYMLIYKPGNLPAIGTGTYVPDHE